MGDFFSILLPEALAAFRFIRPWLLLALPLVALLWWPVRRAALRKPPGTEGIEPHLQDALTVGETARGRILPIDAVALALALVVLAAAGPTWSRMVDPFTAPTAPVVAVLKVTPGMTDPDVAPTRLARAKFKLRDLLEMRAGGRTALIAYAGSAHRVVPFTEDAQIMVPYLEGLEPEVMPQEGANAQAALALALDLLAAEGTPGGILFMLDDLDPQDVAAMQDSGAHTLVFHQFLPEGQRSRGLDQLEGVAVIPVSADDSDLRQIDRRLNAGYRAALLETSDQPWADRGWMLAIPAALLCLLWFRRGWTMRWGTLVILATLSVSAPKPTAADGIADWFFTADQQGMRAFNDRDFARAAELFADPMWQGYALFRDGQYDKAVEVLARVETPEAAFTQGLAHMRNRQYRDGVRAYQTVLERDPAFPGAAENLAKAQEIVTFIEELREESDTGEDTGIGADDTVLDNEGARGTETELQAPQEEGVEMLTAEQWMNTVDTRTGDFLKQRFRLEAAGRSE